METKKRIHKLISMLLCCALLLGTLSTTVLAETITEDEGSILIPFQKVWEDNDDEQGLRPSEISVSLYKYSQETFDEDSATLVEKAEITEEDDWEYTFDISDEEIFYGDGDIYRFKVVEDTVENYEESDHVDPEVLFTPPSVAEGWEKITPCSELHITTTGDEKSVVLAKKGSSYIVWTVDALTDAERRLVFESAADDIKGFGKGDFSDATFISGIGGSFEGMTVAEDEIVFENSSNWSFFALGLYSRSSTEANSASITNKYVPKTITISGEKTWNDENNQDGIRPDSITIKLMNGEEVVETKTVTEDDEWSWSFEDVAKYEDGEEIEYSIVEEAVDGYTATYDGFNVTNSHTPETITISGEKTWDDENNQDGIRPDSITIKLMNGEKVVATKTVTEEDEWSWSFEDVAKYKDGEEIGYSIVEEAVEGYTAAYDGFNVTNSHTPETITISGEKTWNDKNNQDGIRPQKITIKLMNGEKVVETKTVTEDDAWSWTFEDVAKYEDGKEIEYSILEEAVKGYEATYFDFNVINSHTPETITISGEKIWDDGNDQDGIRPESITIKLMNGGKVVETKTVTEDDDWSWTFSNVAKYENGKEIEYSIVEEAVKGYEATYFDFSVVNVHLPETITISGEKIWDDGNDQDGIRPESITIKLMKGKEVVETKTVTADDLWSWSFEDVAKYENGKEIEYSIVEEAVKGYEATYYNYSVVNVYVPSKVSVSVEKKWNDSDNKDGSRPDSVTVLLYADGVAVDTLVLNKANNWKGSFNDLDEYKAGKKIVYAVSEYEVKGYDAEISGNALEGFVITNSHTPIESDYQKPDTGDNTNVLLWTMMLLAAGAALCAELFFRRKKALTK